ncbi:hypothetical protein AB4Y90_03535 [Chryseobacterium sp. 2TAF14]|uniref:hypothetical protein n=1 Tax=Chryseobacterium sp. 2TAF14 TaxID=3233007 RepID=UPI003F8E01EB
MKNLILIFATILLALSSCVSFDRKMIKNDLSVISKNKISSIDGKYKIESYEGINSARTKTDKTRGFNGMFKLQNPKIADSDILEIKSNPINEKQSELRFTLFKKDSVTYTFKYKVKLKKGLLIVDNYNSKCHGIPYLFGGCENFQSRIGLTADNNLLVQNYYDNNGAFMFFMWAGYTINYAEKFERIN